MHRFLLASAVALGLSLALGMTVGAQQIYRLVPVPPDLSSSRPAATCSTLDPTEQRFRFTPAAAIGNGQPLRFTQEPPMLTADYSGTVTLRDFIVTGDVATIQFKPRGSTTIETWSRTGLTDIGGRLVSVFSPSFSNARLTAAMRDQEYGLDYPYLYWGEMLPNGQPGGYYVWLRLLPNNLPQAEVRRLADDVQYSAAVVNIRLDAFADSRLFEDDMLNINFTPLTRKFYQYFEDSYDTIAVTFQDTQVRGGGNSAFHRVVKNEVRGIGLERYDQSNDFGSAGRLKGLEMYFNPAMTSHQTSAHEAAHQWGSYIDFSRLGVTRAGHQADVHDPLMGGGETLIGAVLQGTRRVNGSTIERTPFPIRFHPLTLYAMGVVGRAGVPDIPVFNDQSQFGDGQVAAPDSGTPVGGGSTTVTMASILGAIGAREGPIPSEIQRAIVVVSSGRLLTQREMDYWTFFAQRAADPNGSGTPSYDGYVSFDAATNRTIDMRHEIRPKNGAAIGQLLGVDYPAFARTDFRGVQFDASVPMVFHVGERAHFSGRVTADDRADFFAIIIQFARTSSGSAADDVVSVQGTVSGGTFNVELPAFEARHRGLYTLQTFLFFPPGGSEAPRSIVGPFTVE